MVGKVNIASLERDFNKLNEALEMKYNIKVTLNLNNVTSNKIEGKVTFTDINALSKQQSINATEENTQNLLDLYNAINDKSLEQIHFDKLCGFYGFKPSDYRREFESSDGRKKFMLIGFKRANRSYPVIAEEVGTKKHFKMSVNTAQSLIYKDVLGK